MASAAPCYLKPHAPHATLAVLSHHHGHKTPSFLLSISPCFILLDSIPCVPCVQPPAHCFSPDFLRLHVHSVIRAKPALLLPCALRMFIPPSYQSGSVYPCRRGPRQNKRNLGTSVPDVWNRITVIKRTLSLG